MPESDTNHRTGKSAAKRRSNARQSLVIGAVIVAICVAGVAAAAYFTTPRGRDVGVIDLLASAPAPIAVDAGGGAVRFSIDLTMDAEDSVLNDVAERGRLEVVAEADGREPVRADCATYDGSANEVSPRRGPRPRYLKGAELRCVLPGISRARVRAVATWADKKPDEAILHVRVGDDR